MCVLMKGDLELRAAFLFKMCDAQSNGSVEKRDVLYMMNHSDNEQGRQDKYQELTRIVDRLFADADTRHTGWGVDVPRAGLKPFQEWCAARCPIARPRSSAADRRRPCAGCRGTGRPPCSSNGCSGSRWIA